MDPRAALDHYFQELEAQDAFAGVVRITRAGAELYAGMFGDASRAWRARNTLDTRFDTASITKLFTAVAALQLVGRGALALDTRAVEFLGLAGTAIAPEVTLGHLLTHTSGIADDADEEAGESYADLFKTKPNYAIRATADFLPQFAYKPANFAPGQGCRYCNCGYVLAGLMVERASGMEYRDYVREHVFAPAGMAESGFFDKELVHPNLAEGADPIRAEDGALVGWRRNIYSFPPIGSPDGGACVTAADLERFLRAVREGRLLTPELTAAFLTPQVHYRDRDGWTQMFGYGLWFRVEGGGQVVFYQKEGINPGVSGLIRHYPAHDLSVSLLSNMEDGAWQPIRKLHELIVGGAFGLA
jgi:CubicO group peptidase (beta-lactamase class C family)